MINKIMLRSENRERKAGQLIIHVAGKLLDLAVKLMIKNLNLILRFFWDWRG